MSLNQSLQDSSKAKNVEIKQPFTSKKYFNQVINSVGTKSIIIKQINSHHLSSMPSTPLSKNDVCLYGLDSL